MQGTFHRKKDLIFNFMIFNTQSIPHSIMFSQSGSILFSLTVSLVINNCTNLMNYVLSYCDSSFLTFCAKFFSQLHKIMLFVEKSEECIKMAIFVKYFSLISFKQPLDEIITYFRIKVFRYKSVLIMWPGSCFIQSYD